jgi:hypothetical protein
MGCLRRGIGWGTNWDAGMKLFKGLVGWIHKILYCSYLCYVKLIFQIYKELGALVT